MREYLRKLFQRLSHKYRLVVMNDNTLEEKLSFRLSRLNVYVFISTIVVLLTFLIVTAIVLTPLKEYIPGYQDITLREDALKQHNEIDSINTVLRSYERYVQDLRAVFEGDFSADSLKLASIDVDTSGAKDYDSIELDRISSNDSLLRNEVENMASFALTTEEDQEALDLSKLYFVEPLANGQVVDEFDPQKDHFGVDVVAPENTPVRSVLDGVVVLENWTLDTGHVIGVQHSNNLLSFYKHNSVLLKKVGNFVKAGDVIAIVGDSGEQSTGEHLHFELWHNQSPVNPQDYINF